MNRIVVIFIAAIAVLALAGLLVTTNSPERRGEGGPSAEVPENGDPSRARYGRQSTSSTLADKETIRRFWAIYREGVAMKNGGRWQEAAQKFLESHALDPRHEDSLYNLGNCYFELNRFEEALEAFVKLVTVNPLSHRGHLQIGSLRSCPQAGSVFDLDAAEASLMRALEVNQEETGSLLRLGEVALVKGEYDRAGQFLELANRSNFRAVEGYYLRAYLKWRAGDAEESIRLMEEAWRQSQKPKVFAEVPGEGDTKPGSALPPTTLDRKRLISSPWEGLAERYPDGLAGLSLDREFQELHVAISGLRDRLDLQDSS